VCKSPHLKILIIVVLLIAQACASHYQANYAFNEAFENGNLESALNVLRNSSLKNNRKSEFLYLVNNGLLLSVLGKYEESNEYLTYDCSYGEDYRVNYFNEAASYLTNPMVTAYRGEDHEHLFVLYYKAMNFLKMGKYAEALVECRRLNIRLQQLSDRYDSDKKYQRDAFIHLLMGLIYEADRDYNNAFIAYRNAYEIYTTDFRELFNAEPPEQLKLDILKTAWLSGLVDEFQYFKSKFGREDYTYVPTEGGDLIFIWHNGLAPVKAEWSINFVVNRQGNMVTFVNDQYGLSFPFNISDYSDEDKKGLAAMEVFRVAFPKYIERPEYYSDASLTIEDTTFDLQPVENINQIATHVLSQRMALEFSKALLRAAIKKSAEYQMRKEDEALGSLIGIINAITEKADTRNWQTLPHSIYYSRVPLQIGTNEVTLNLNKRDASPEPHSFTYVIDKRTMLFHTFTSLESRYPGYSLY